MPRYKASIIYDEESVQLLDATLQRTFFYWRRYVLFAVCVVFLFMGLRFTIRTGIGLVCILIGCLLAPFAANYVIPGSAARMSLEAIKGKQLLMEYEFGDESFTCRIGKKETVYGYRRIVRLIDHGGHLYLCTDLNQACMVDKRSIEPHREDRFMEFISKRAGLRWTKQPTVLGLSLKTIRFNRENTKLDRRESA